MFLNPIRTHRVTSLFAYSNILDAPSRRDTRLLKTLGFEDVSTFATISLEQILAAMMDKLGKTAGCMLEPHSWNRVCLRANGTGGIKRYFGFILWRVGEPVNLQGMVSLHWNMGWPRCVVSFGNDKTFELITCQEQTKIFVPPRCHFCFCARAALVSCLPSNCSRFFSEFCLLSTYGP